MEITLREEVAGCDFGDQRLSKRLGKVMDRLGQHPTLSIPAALATRAELEAGYRFFDNPEVTPDRILATHRTRTIERILGQRVCLLVQDTTELELTRPRQQVAGAGPLSCDSRRGAYLHPLQAYTPGQLNLGTVWHKSWTRDSIDTKRTAKEKSKYLETLPIEDKESHRWLEGQHAARHVAELCADTQCVLVCDSEADIYEVFSASRETSHGRPLELLIRGCQNRATDEKGKMILDHAHEAESLFSMILEVSAREAKTKVESGTRGKSREARAATVDVRVCTVTLRPPPRPDRELPPVTLRVVLVEETVPPAGAEPIQWMLLTTLPTGTREEILAVIEYYRCRWLIENYFKILKSGCRVEERQFERLARELNALAVYQVVAWRVQLLCHLGRACPDLACDAWLEEAEWKSVYIVATGKAPPAHAPTINTMIRLIAGLGGYVARQKTEPGNQTLWIGMQRMRDLACGYDAFGPGSKMTASTCVVR